MRSCGNSATERARVASVNDAQTAVKTLSAGGTHRHRELLAPFGLNAGDPAFWQKGLSVIRGFIDTLARDE